MLRFGPPREEAPGYGDPIIHASYNGFEHWEKLMGKPRTKRLADTEVMPPDVPVRLLALYP